MFSAELKHQDSHVPNTGLLLGSELRLSNILSLFCCTFHLQKKEHEKSSRTFVTPHFVYTILSVETPVYIIAGANRYQLRSGSGFPSKATLFWIVV
jgi:hypothetical protein